MAGRPLDTYLNDHLAGATFGSDLAGQLADRLADTPSEPRMRAVADEIVEDRETLLGVMDRLRVMRNPAKEALTWVTEKVARVEWTGVTVGERDAGLFLALETLSLGVEGKALLWAALAAVGERYPVLAGLDFAALHARAEEQRAVLEDERGAVAARLFTGD